ncbi:hypothetical protein AB6N23_16220, partial [Cellulomonas sp. 179-A 9B4 NHS]|uniref:hypothetical protein n=1 Tax=Cellulomonas sp. 179-A 9B4 NHS TaxID=3142379 RepID=UPI0039A33FB7
HVDFPITQEGTPERLLTGADFDVESGVGAPDGAVAPGRPAASGPVWRDGQDGPCGGVTSGGPACRDVVMATFPPTADEVRAKASVGA